jgi:hypothetical protein
LPPAPVHCFSDIWEKPWFLQEFRPLQAFAALLQALWPLQALAPMHLPAAAFAVVDTVDIVTPARNSVAAAAASVAPDLESNFMTISSMIVDIKMRCRRSQNRTTNEVLDAHQVAQRFGRPALPKKIHPEVGTGIERFGYNGFKRKFLFLSLDIPSMPNTGA